MMKKKEKFPKIYLITMIIIMYIPIFITILYSFNESKLSSIWGGFSLDWYKKLFADEEMFLALKNSIVLAGISCTLAGIIGTLAAVGMPHVKLKSKKVVEYISTIPIMIPEIILAMGFLVYLDFINIPDGMISLIIAHTTFCVPYVYMQVKARLIGMDPSLAEAAKDLGASDSQVFRDITLPLIAPAIAAGMLLAFSMSFDDVVITSFLTGSKTTTLPIKIYTQTKTGVTPEINAMCTFLLVITILIMFTANRVSKIGKKEIAKAA